MRNRGVLGEGVSVFYEIWEEFLVAFFLRFLSWPRVGLRVLEWGCFCCFSIFYFNSFDMKG